MDIKVDMKKRLDEKLLILLDEIEELERKRCDLTERKSQIQKENIRDIEIQIDEIEEEKNKNVSLLREIILKVAMKIIKDKIKEASLNTIVNNVVIKLISLYRKAVEARPYTLIMDEILKKIQGYGALTEQSPKYTSFTLSQYPLSEQEKRIIEAKLTAIASPEKVKKFLEEIHTIPLEDKSKDEEYEKLKKETYKILKEMNSSVRRNVKIKVEGEKEEKNYKLSSYDLFFCRKYEKEPLYVLPVVGNLIEKEYKNEIRKLKRKKRDIFPQNDPIFGTIEPDIVKVGKDEKVINKKTSSVFFSPRKKEITEKDVEEILRGKKPLSPLYYNSQRLIGIYMIGPKEYIKEYYEKNFKKMHLNDYEKEAKDIFEGVINISERKIDYYSGLFVRPSGIIFLRNIYKELKKEKEKLQEFCNSLGIKAGDLKYLENIKKSWLYSFLKKYRNTDVILNISKSSKGKPLYHLPSVLNLIVKEIERKNKEKNKRVKIIEFYRKKGSKDPYSATRQYFHRMKNHLNKSIF